MHLAMTFHALGSEEIPTTVIRGKLEVKEGTRNNLVSTPIKSTLITLDNGEKITYSRENDGSFVFYEVKPGIHLLDVQSDSYLFSQVKIQVDSDSTSVKCIEYVYPGAMKQPLPHPLLLQGHAKFNYFEARPGFSPFSMLRNPMVLMMLFSVFIMVLMPKMMENLDDDQKEQMQRQMEMQNDPSKMLSNLWGELSGAGQETGNNRSLDGGGRKATSERKSSKRGK